MDYLKLYKRNTSGSIQEWEIEVQGNSYRTIYGVQGGSKIISAFTVCEGKNLGKKNETTPEEQAELEAKALVEKKIRREGYWKNINDIDKVTFLEPMLGKSYDDHKHKITFPCYAQRKIDGCVSHDTEIELLDIGIVKISDIPNLLKRYKELKIKSYCIEDDSIVYEKILAFKEDKEIDIDDVWLEIELEDGTIIKITDDHPLWMPDIGVWRKAGDLSIGDNLLTEKD